MMPWTKNRAKNFEELVGEIVKYTTDSALHGDKAWQIMRSEPWPRGTILKCQGMKGKDHFYIGLMPLDIVAGSTYAKWFLTKEVLSTHFVWSEKGLNNRVPFSLSGNTLTPTPPGDGIHPPPEPSTCYRFISPDIFSHSAKVLFFGVFKQYAPDLDWHEQPGGIEIPDLPLMSIRYYADSIRNPNPNTYPRDWNPPVFPGAGYPAIGLDAKGPRTGKFDYYIVKNKCGLTIAINNFDQVGASNWESIYAGLFDPYADYEYAFPACVIGGTSGFTMRGESRWYYKDQRSPTPVTGLKLDYRPKNWSLIHGVPTFAAAGLDDSRCPTQAAAMMADGRWKYFANYVQGVEIVPHEHGPENNRYYSYDYPYGTPVRPRNIKAFLRPTECDLDEYSSFYQPKADEGERATLYQLLPLEFVESPGGESHHLLGRAPNYYHMSRPICRYGELKINGTKYLVLPNVWEERKFYLHWYSYDAGFNRYDPDPLVEEDWKLEAERRKIRDIMNVAIKLED